MAGTPALRPTAKRFSPILLQFDVADVWSAAVRAARSMGGEFRSDSGFFTESKTCQTIATESRISARHLFVGICRRMNCRSPNQI